MALSKVHIRSGIFAGQVGELVERGETTSKIRLVVFGRETTTPIPNRDFSISDEALDPFEHFAEEIRLDRFMEAREALLNWWLEQEHDVSARTWDEHLRRIEAIEPDVAEETKRLVAELRRAVPGNPGHPEIDAHFREHAKVFQPYRTRRPKSDIPTFEADKRREEERGRRVEALQRVAFRAWWAVQPRSTESCAKFLQEAWAGKDHVAMAKAEHQAFDKWGKEAVALILNQTRPQPITVAALDDLPDGHRWREHRQRDPGEAVRRIFADLWECAPELFERFAHAVRAIYVLERAGAHCLLYACDAKQHDGKILLTLLVGGPALDDVELEAIDGRLREEVRARGWRVPAELRKLYRVHHGFGFLSPFTAHFDSAFSVYPADQLSVVGELMNEIAREKNFEPAGYRFDDLLAFCEDGAGNSENFFRPGPGEEPIGTVDWDHETREISSVRSFWEYLKESPREWWFG